MNDGVERRVARTDLAIQILMPIQWKRGRLGMKKITNSIFALNMTHIHILIRLVRF